MKVLFVSLLMLSATQAFSQAVWIAIAPGPKNWSDGFNWSTGVPPGAGQTAVFDGTSNIACWLTGDVVINNIVITNGFSGSINLRTFKLSIEPSGNNFFEGGNIVGTGEIVINSSSSATFDGTYFGPNVDVSATLNFSTGIFTAGPGTTFDGDVTVTAHSILLNGSTYNGTTMLTKSSISLPSASVGNGGNTFNGPTTISNAMNAAFISANINPDIFNGPLTLSLQGTAPSCWLQMAHTAPGNQFNNNVRIRSDNTPIPGMYSAAATARLTIGANGGTSTLADGYTIDEVTPGFNEGPDPGEFAVGELWIENLTQLGATPQSINLRIPSADASVSKLKLIVSNCVFNANVDFSASNFYISASTFNGTVNNFRKTRGGGTDFTYPPPSIFNSWDGGNTFNNSTNFFNHHNSTLVLGAASPDIFNGNVTLFSEQSTSHYRIAEGPGVTEFKGNISISRQFNSMTEVRIDFGRGGGTAIFDGSSGQSISFDKAHTNYVLRFGNLRINNNNGLQIGLPAIITNNLDFQTGILTVADSLTFKDNATVTGAKDGSYANAFIRKQGNDAFIFPLGASNRYHPLGISAPMATTAEFSAQYFEANHGLGATADGGLVKVSDCEYWTLNRLAGTDNPTATLFWNAPYCRADYITKEDELMVARWSGTLWNNLGQANLQIAAAPDGTEGNLTTSAALPDAASHTLTFGSISLANMLPIRLVSFEVNESSDGVELLWQTSSEKNNAFFTIERMQDTSFESLATIPGAGTTATPQSYLWTDHDPLPGLSYYRLKQTDVDGNYWFSEVKALRRKPDTTPYPNPVEDFLYINAAAHGDETARLVLTDMAGNELHNQPTSEKLDMRNCRPGIYHLRIWNKGTIESYRILKK